MDGIIAGSSTYSESTEVIKELRLHKGKRGVEDDAMLPLLVSEELRYLLE